MSHTTTQTAAIPTLIAAISEKLNQRFSEFITAIDQVPDAKGLNTWIYNDLLPKGKDISGLSLSDQKDYLKGRKARQTEKSIRAEVERINHVMEAGELVSITISVEWKKSKMWGSNPSASAECRYIKDGHSNYARYESGSIGGCGFDKGSTAVANVLNQINEVLKPLYLMKEENPTAKNHDLFGYGSGYFELPTIEGGVGVSCYPAIFEKIGFEFKTTASGKSFDVYTITKK